MGIDWGVPVQRKKRVEKFDTPVITMAAISGKGSGRKFSFNKAAQDALGLVIPDEDSGVHSLVTFGKHTETGEVAVMSLTKENDKVQAYKTNKSFSFSDKKTFEFVTRTLGLSNTTENHLHIAQKEGESYFVVTHHEAEGGPIVEDTPEATTEVPLEEEELAVMPAPVSETPEVMEPDPVVEEAEANEAEAVAPEVTTEETKEEEW